MKSMKSYVAAAIAISAIVATVPVVGAQETTGATSATTPSRSSIRAANMHFALMSEDCALLDICPTSNRVQTGGLNEKRVEHLHSRMSNGRRRPNAVRC